jgi:hypothetical protein
MFKYPYHPSEKNDTEAVLSAYKFNFTEETMQGIIVRKAKDNAAGPFHPRLLPEARTNTKLNSNFKHAIAHHFCYWFFSGSSSLSKSSNVPYFQLLLVFVRTFLFFSSLFLFHAVKKWTRSICL